jgi:AbrB family looped-hinge helix DNA binding protein
MVATLTSKGQLTLPKNIRAQFDLQPGDKLDFVVRENGTVEVVPLKQPASKLRGILPKPPKAVSIDAMNEAIAAGAAASGRD